MSTVYDSVFLQSSLSPSSRRVLLARQGYLCAGCGMRVEPQYASKFRYCEYLGRYFCTACHRNQVAVIPGKVLAKWDFNRYISEIPFLQLNFNLGILPV